MSKGIQKKIHRNNLRVEENEVKKFDRAYARIMQSFNDFMFGNGSGSFIQFDAEYRNLAEQEYKYIKPDKLDFYKFAIDNEGADIYNCSIKFQFPLGFIKAQYTAKVQR